MAKPCIMRGWYSIVSFLWLTCIISSTSLETVAAGGDRKLFSLFVYHERTLLSSGYQNWASSGCGVFTVPAKNVEFIEFFTDVENRIGELALDIVPLFKQYDLLVPLYDAIITNATAHGINIKLLESNLVPGDSCSANCPETCHAAPKSSNDSCTPSYMGTFHMFALKLFKRHPTTTFGLVYDIEQSETPSNYSEIWSTLVNTRSNFVAKLDALGDNVSFSGFSVVRPSIKGHDEFSPWISGAQTISHMNYFTPLPASPNWNDDLGPILGPQGSIKEEISFCASAVGNNCSVQVGFETSAEAAACKTYQRCHSSFVWGGGLPNGTSLISWIENTLEPFMLKHNIDVRTSFDRVPYFIEHHASFMAYQMNIKKKAFPASSCFRGEEGCSTCCYQQKNKKVCSD